MSGAVIYGGFTTAAYAAGPLPVPSGIWVTSGSTAQSAPVVSGATMNINQVSQNVTLDWQSFNIDHGYTVNFNQPGSSAVALNQIHQADPVQIRGSLNANGEVWLVNQNGIVFGQGAQVNVHGLIASTLNITTDALNSGIAPATPYTQPAFSQDANAGSGASAAITVEPGASLNTNSAGGRIFLFAPNVTNQGAITANDGQVALAAGTKIYIQQPPSSSGQSGLVVEVDQGGTVTNGSAANANVTDPAQLLGQIVADRGTATLVGLAVNQLGRVSASTAIRANGTIHLLARNSQFSGTSLTPSQGGTVTLGPNSVTQSNPDLSDTSTTVDGNNPTFSQVIIAGKTVHFASDSSVVAHGGDVNVFANFSGIEKPPQQVSDGRVVMDAGSSIDVSGEQVALPPGRNTLTVKLQSNELKDRSVQKSSILFGQTVTVDLRVHGTLSDGTEWVGTPLADLTAAAAAGVLRTVAERNTVGGSVSIQSEGSIVLAPGSSINVSGGSATYPSGPVQTTQLIYQGQLVDIGSADPNIAYDAIYGVYDQAHPIPNDPNHGTITNTWSLFVTSGAATTGNNGTAYTEGKDAGQITLEAPQMILDGSLLGGTQPGIYQRDPTDTTNYTRTGPTQSSPNVKLAITRPYDQMPKPGTLQIGEPSTNSQPDFFTGDVTISAAPVLSSLPGFDPLTDTIPSTVTARVSPSLFGAGKLGSLVVYADGTFDSPSGTVLDLGPQGSLAATAGTILIAGAIKAPGGTVDLTAENTLFNNAIPHSDPTGAITVGSGATVDVAGLWTNDSNLLNPSGSMLQNATPLIINGGGIDLQAYAVSATVGGLNLEPGSTLRADGGASIGASGSLTAGAGGTISLGVRQDALVDQGVNYGVPLVLGGGMSAFALYDGGTLTINANDICIGPSACGTPGNGHLDLTPQFFQSNGFSAYNLTAAGGAINIESGTTIRPKQQNFILDALSSLQPTGADIRSFSTIGFLDPSFRQPTDLSLAVKVQNPYQFDDAKLQASGILDLPTGAAIMTDPGGAVTLASDTRLYLDGTINAPGGTIAATLTSGIKGDIAFKQFMPSQTLWLGPDARLLAQGVFQPVPNSRGLVQGNLFNGGAVTLDAQSGYVVMQAGSLIDVTGATAAEDLVQVSGGNALQTQKVNVASDGGSITLKAAEGILADGNLRAGAVAAGARAGSLTVIMNALNRNDDPILTPAALGLPLTPRQIVVQAGDGSFVPVGLAPGEAVPNSVNGEALLSDSRLTTAGFGDITLQARDYSRDLGLVGSAVGEIRMSGNANLSATRRITLDAATLASDGGSATISAPYVEIGNTDDGSLTEEPSTAVQPSPDPVSGSGHLTVNASMIDLIGNIGLSGLAATYFNSTGDIRLRGVQVVQDQHFSTQIIGNLKSAGNLYLSAPQVYPTTLSDFTLAVTGNADGLIQFNASGAATPVVSVGGSLTVQAPYIMQSGNVKAPLGTVNLEAGTLLTLAPGSLTSTSLGGIETLFGQVALGTDWVYLLNGGVTNSAPPQLVFTQNSNRSPDPFPQARVYLQAPSVQLKAGAVVDESGGGNLLSYEFQPGLGGTVDVLNPATSGGSYAIVPWLSGLFAPFDPQEYQNFNLLPGESVTLASGASGLAAGTYPLLPPRFALLPGAFLVTPVSGYTNIAPGTTFTLPQGGTVVAGRRVFATGVDGDSLTSGFDIRTASDIAKMAQYDLHTANSFAGLAGVPLPRDGGTLQIVAGNSLELGGRLNAAAAAGGRGGVAEFTGNNIEITGDVAHPSVPGALLIDASGLSTLGADSLIIGGTRDSADTLNVTAQTVTVDGNVSLAAPELLFAATDTLHVATGARLYGQGDVVTGTSLTVSGDGALLRLAAGPQDSLVRTGSTGAAGTLTIDAGAQLDAAGSMLLDSTLDTTLAGDIGLGAGGALSLSATTINLGTPGGTVSGLTLNQDRLSSLAGSNLTLISRGSIDLYGSLALTATQLNLRAGALRGFGSPTDTVAIQSDALTLSNAANVSAPAGSGTGTGTLQISGNSVSLGSGDMAVSGFGHTTITASNALTSTGTTGTPASPDQLHVAGDLNLTAGTLTAVNGAAYQLVSDGALQVSSTGESSSAVAATGLNAYLGFEGTSVSFNGRVDLHAGQVAIAATGSNAADALELGAAARIDVSGISETFVDHAVYSGAGSVSLSSAAGDVVTDAGAAVDLSAPGGGNAGQLSLAAPGGTVSLAGDLLGTANTGFASGSAAIDVGSMSNFSAINAQLNAGGFGATRTLRVRSGDLNVGAGDVVTASTLGLEVDNGNLTVAGTLNASGVAGGSITLSASGAIELLSGAMVDAHATAGGNTGGKVQFFTASATDGTSATGGVFLDTGSTIDVSGGGGGTVTLRLPRASLLTLTDASPDLLNLAGTINGQASTVVEGFQGYSRTNISSSDVSTGGMPYLDAVSFMNNAPTIETALGAAGSASTFHLRPGVEFDSTAGLTLGAIFDLHSWRFGSGNEPGILTLRSVGTLTFNASLSDGFNGIGDLTSTSAFLVPSLLTGPSWSYRLVAGANLTAANPMLTAGNTADLIVSAGTASTVNTYLLNNNVTLAKQNAIRTGTGSIDIAVAHDLTLGNRASVIYTAGYKSLTDGVAQNGILLSSGTGSLGNHPYPEGGGDVTIGVGHSINGDLNNDTNLQFVTSWLWRQGDAGSQNRATGWTVAPEYFEGGIGALAGGNVSITAGADLNNLSVSIASIGVQVGSTRNNDGNSPAQLLSSVDIIGGGALSIKAGGDIKSGMFYVGKGSADIQAGGSLTFGRTVSASDTTPLYPILALGDATASVTAGGNLTLGGVVNPTMVPQGWSQLNVSSVIRSRYQSYFFTYGADSAVNLSSLTGDVTLSDGSSAFTTVFGYDTSFGSQNAANVAAALTTFAPSLTAAALAGNVNVDGSVTLYPSASGQLNLLGNTNVNINSYVLLSDTSGLPTIDSPQSFQGGSASLTNQLDASYAQEGDLANASNPPIHLADTVAAQAQEQPNLIVARLGDVVSAATNQRVFLSKKTDVVAGGDIINPNIQIQNTSALDVSLIQAGGSLTYTSPRRPNVGDTGAGTLVPNSNGIQIWGPGRLLVETGGNVELGTSNGILSEGNTYNSALPAQGAAITLIAGLNGHQPDYQGFITQYLASGNLTGQILNDLGAISPNASLQAYENFVTQHNLASAALDLATITPSSREQSLVTSVVDALNAALPAQLTAPAKFDTASYLMWKATGDIDYLLGDVYSQLSKLNLTQDQVSHLFTQLPSSLQISQTYYDNYVGNVLPNLDAAGYVKHNAAVLQAVNTAYNGNYNSISSSRQAALAYDLYFGELRTSARQAAATKDNSLGFAATDAFLPAASGAGYQGDINMYFSQVYTVAGGDIQLLAPGGNVNVGLATPPAAFGITKAADQLGIVAESTGDVLSYLSGNFDVNQSRTFAADGGDILIWSSFGSIDAGRGATTAVSAPAPVYSFNSNGQLATYNPPAIQGSGIQALVTTPGRDYGAVYLVAPNGSINAGEAGIKGSSIFVNTQNFIDPFHNTSGTTVGAPSLNVSSVSASVAGAAGAATTAATKNATQSTNNTNGNQAAEAAAKSLANGGMSFISVEVLGFGNG